MRTVASVLVLLAASPAALAGQGDPAAVVIEARTTTLRAGGTVRVGGNAIASQVALPAFYEGRGYRPAWGDRAQVDDLLRAIRESADDGLDPKDYDLAAIERLRPEATTPERAAELDLLLTDAALRLAYHLRFGKVDPTSLFADWNFRRDPVDAPGFPVARLEQALAGGEVYRAITAERPLHPMYLAMRSALVAYRRIAEAGGWPAIPQARSALKPGATDPRVPLLRRRLQITGDLADGSDTSTVFDSVLALGVRNFQDRHGLTPDGAVGPATLRALNVPVGQRIGQILAALERGRWVLHDLPSRFVVVNVAGFRAYYVKDDRLVWGTNVVVGKPYTKTPIFRADMKYVVVNPTWTIPPGIMRSEVRPAMARDPGYLGRKGFKLIGGQVVQPPGDDNALGRIKLMFPNPHMVYLHDTPAKSLFGRETRTFSHGCIRVQDPFELAALVLDDPALPRAALLDSAKTDRTITIYLREPLPVLLLYWTAAVGMMDGKVYFYEDVYGRDPGILRGLGQPFAFNPRYTRPATGPKGS